ncbi:hydroxyacid dehydrogenase [Agrobacterium leguminum]|uniref:D-3-phosphoglycerate dehydrogenase protein n=1 Tax=Agrobacterium deltaense NCPPB 1641 TaxID=1183425 RepID=A0A1S7TP10_9HYPH|nr:MULTISPECIES: hydroxyacid dehydrogenase [Agrobacterium]WFS65955.1 hydroxyacid dehydrogenase [Agrobacterium leguminum]CVI56271.1 D-3-phosphoglycerate dehydrogenase protein [Agrobacterium deltaense NCPPB 1641]
MKCLIVQPIHADGLALLREAGVEPVLCPKPDMATVAAMIKGCDAVITRDAGLSASAIEAGDRLRVIAVHGTGHDAVDKEAATAKGVLVCNTPGANARSVSELALGLALAAARRIPAADRSERAGVHGFRETESFSELSGKTALIVGWGAIGAGLGRMLKAALDMRVLVYSPRVADLDGFERADSLEDGLRQADLISLHTPLRAETRGLFGEQAISAVKPGAILINTARAGLVDEAALARAIETGRIAAAGLDVYSSGAPTGPLAAGGRVIFTPHLGGTTLEALRRVALGSARHVLTALAGERPVTALNAPQEIMA